VLPEQDQRDNQENDSGTQDRVGKPERASNAIRRVVRLSQSPVSLQSACH